jgi:hypothetical protein
MVLVQELQDNCNEFLNLGHTDTISLKKDVYHYEKFSRMLLLLKEIGFWCKYDLLET